MTERVARPPKCIRAAGRAGNVVTRVRPRTARQVDIFYLRSMLRRLFRQWAKCECMLISLLVTRLKWEEVIFDRKLMVVTSRWLTVVPVLLLVTLSSRLSTLPVVMVRIK